MDVIPDVYSRRAGMATRRGRSRQSVSLVSMLLLHPECTWARAQPRGAAAGLACALMKPCANCNADVSTPSSPPPRAAPSRRACARPAGGAGLALHHPRPALRAARPALGPAALPAPRLRARRARPRLARAASEAAAASSEEDQRLVAAPAGHDDHDHCDATAIRHRVAALAVHVLEATLLAGTETPVLSTGSPRRPIALLAVAPKALLRRG